MPKARELTVAIQDRPGALGKCLAIMAERGVNILAFQSYVEEGESLARFLVDDAAAGTKALGEHSMIFEVTEVVTVRLAHKPGELARAAMKLGEEQINVNYSYSGVEPGSKFALAVFGVDNLTKAA
ncbi:MAG TPA: ACT domain-containing protein, partial [Candidatus Acidoferrales bacterium]|nr:ACT domain-containing protein [Candidatus Acidoferrales bacterium]